MQNKIEAILFDVGGTLRTSIPKERQDKLELIRSIQERIGSHTDAAAFQSAR